MATELKTTVTAIDGNANPLGFTIDPGVRTAGYKSYEGTLTTGSPTIEFDCFGDIGDFCSKCSISNPALNPSNNGKFTVQFSYKKSGGFVYGDAITVTTSVARNFDAFILFGKIKITLVGTTSADYSVVFL